MKIRIRGNSVRYRLTMSEVETFSRTGYFEEATHFGSGVFRYALKAVPGNENMDARFDNNTITLTLAEKDAREWAGSSRIGFEYELQLPEGKVLTLLLEKDFACLDETGEDQSDNYPNPRAHDQ